jgi:hypothetical protein
MNAPLKMIVVSALKIPSPQKTLAIPRGNFLIFAPWDAIKKGVQGRQKNCHHLNTPWKHQEN